MELPFLQKHDYSITNYIVRIDNDQVPLYFSENLSKTVKSSEIVHTIGMIQDEAMRVYYINTSKYDISNLEIEDDEIQIKELLDLLRLDYIENSYRELRRSSSHIKKYSIPLPHHFLVLT